MRALRHSAVLRAIVFTTILSLLWLQVGPALAGTVQQNRLDRQRATQMVEAAERASKLPPGQTQTPSPALRAKIAAKEQAAAQAQRKTIPAVRLLTLAEMKRATGRGPLRNPYFNGNLPWQRSLHDVNLCNGNLFKSFTDVQVAPARGAGLVLQRTYNSNDAREGAFGVGWSHAYDIRIQEATDVAQEAGNTNALSVQPVSGTGAGGSAASASVSDAVNEVPRTDFFGAKHTYHRDADGLYSPPPYMYDEMNSDYNSALVNGPLKVESDTEKGMDGTVKHYSSVLTLADGTPGNERACDSITDRYGNATLLDYGQSYVQPDGSTRKLLTTVTDPTGRALTFHWSNLGTTAAPHYRIVEVDAPTDPSTGNYAYRVAYAYYALGDPASGGAPYELQSVTLDPGGLSRTTTYTYTSQTGSYYTDSQGDTATATEVGLMATISDPLGHTVSYSYSDSLTLYGGTNYSYTYLSPTQTFWVASVTEPGGVDAAGNTRTHTWAIVPRDNNPISPNGRWTDCTDGTGLTLHVVCDTQFREAIFMTNEISYGIYAQYFLFYDDDNNLLWEKIDPTATDQTQPAPGSDFLMQKTLSTYGPHGNVLTSGFLGSPAQNTTVYYNASQYFQKQATTDMDGHTTTMAVGAASAGTAGDPDPNAGDRGQVLSVQDAGYNDSNSPSYRRQFTYTYNQWGQKVSQTDLNGVVTTYAYGTNGDDLGNLIQVVQDPGGAGHLNRTTAMHYDVMGRVLQSTDPAGLTSTFFYNSLGQPLTVTAPVRGGVAGETITYAYDTNGRTLSVSDAHRTTTMGYEAGCDRVHSVSDSVTGAVSYTYLVGGERASMTLPGGGTWTYTYASPDEDPSSDLSSAFLEEDWSSYEDVAVLPKDQPDEMTLRLRRVTDDQGRVTDYGLDGIGQLHTLRTGETYSGSDLTSYTETDYTKDFAPVAAPWPDYGRFSHYWLQGITTTFHQKTNSGWVSRVLSSNTYSYDNDGQRLTNTVSTQPVDASGNPQADGSNNPVLTSRTETYSYDDLNRLKTVDYGDGQTQGYSFDAMGNRLGKTDSVAGSTTYAFDAANRLTATNGQAITSDMDGNTTSNGTRISAWDSQNRMTSCTVGGTTPSTSTYTYGADGLRRSATVNGTTTYYIYDGSMLVREMQKNAQGVLQSTATYLQGARGPEYRRDDTQFEGTYMGAPANKVRWYVYDGLGSVVGEVDPSGNLTTTDKYDVYGAKRTGGTGTGTSRQGFVGSLGHITDSETGLIYMRARYYDPNTGRFDSEDLSKNNGNWFAYCDDNPTNKVDETGNSPLDIIVLAIAALFGGATENYATGRAGFENFAIGAVIALLTTAAGLLWGPIGGFVVGALLNGADAIRTGNNPWTAGLVGGIFGGVGGWLGGPEGPLAAAGKAAAAEYSNQLLLYVMLGVDEGAGQWAGTSAGVNL